MSQELAIPRPRSTRPAASRVHAPGAAAPAWLLALVVVNFAISTSSFNPKLLGLSPDSSLQQYLTLGSWLAMIGASVVLPARARLAPSLDVVLMIAFYALAVTSVMWSDLEPASLQKAGALAVTTFGAYRLALIVDIEDLAECALVALGLVAAASVAAVVAIPELGVNHEWMHDGLWQGVFESKQSLGFVGAFLMFFAFCRLKAKGGWLLFALGFGLGAACVLGSGSRGGGAAALAAIVCVAFSGRKLGVSRVLVFLPFAITVGAMTLMLHLAGTGERFIAIGDVKTDLTERVLIWAYGLQHWPERPFLGFGLNGFWSNPDILFSFKREHGWVLDNFHSGYLTILMETGLVGTVLFAAAAFALAVRLSTLAARRMVQPEVFTLIVGFLCLVFFDNMTETYFLRSTNFVAAMTAIVLFASGLVPRARAARQSGAAMRGIEPATRGRLP